MRMFDGRRSLAKLNPAMSPYDVNQADEEWANSISARKHKIGLQGVTLTISIAKLNIAQS
jgi:hypothetical protein